jgi:integrase
MPTRSFTVASVARLKPPPTGQIDHFDKGYPGLALRVSYGGARAWIYLYRFHGKLRRISLGRYPGLGLAEARTAWRDARLQVARGENPARPKPTHADSFSAIADEWLKRDQAHRRTYLETKRKIDVDVRPFWNDRPFASITRRDVIELIDRIADRGALTAARRTQGVLHRLFRWARGRGIVEVNPVSDLPKPGGAEVRRDRVLNDAELALVWCAASNTEWPWHAIFKLLILTGARRQEIGALRWSEIDGNTIRLEGARTKNGEPREIPLAPMASMLIQGLPRIGGSDFVFSTTGGGTPVRSYGRIKALLDERIAKLNHGRTLPAWRIHDLRRSVATGLQRLQARLETIEAILGHVSGSRSGIVGIYQRYEFGPEARLALEAWARHVEAIISGTPAKVVKLERRPR